MRPLESKDKLFGNGVTVNNVLLLEIFCVVYV